MAEKFNPLDPLGVFGEGKPPDPLGIFKKERPPALKEADRLALQEGLRLALPDEQKAVGEYTTMANLARIVGRDDIARRLTEIAGQESEHHKSISEMLRTLGG